MKNVKFLWMAMFSFLWMASVLGQDGSGNENDHKMVTAEDSVRQQLTTALSDVEHKGMVYVHFQVNQTKSFELLDVAGLNDKLVQEVENTLKVIKLDVSKIPDGKYLIKVQFVDNKYALTPRAQKAQKKSAKKEVNEKRVSLNSN